MLATVVALLAYSPAYHRALPTLAAGASRAAAARLMAVPEVAPALMSVPADPSSLPLFAAVAKSELLADLFALFPVIFTGLRRLPPRRRRHRTPTRPQRPGCAILELPRLTTLHVVPLLPQVAFWPSSCSAAKRSSRCRRRPSLRPPSCSPTCQACRSSRACPTRSRTEGRLTAPGQADGL